MLARRTRPSCGPWRRGTSATAPRGCRRRRSGRPRRSRTCSWFRGRGNVPSNASLRDRRRRRAARSNARRLVDAAATRASTPSPAGVRSGNRSPTREVVARRRSLRRRSRRRRRASASAASEPSLPLEAVDAVDRAPGRRRVTSRRRLADERRGRCGRSRRPVTPGRAPRARRRPRPANGVAAVLRGDDVVGRDWSLDRVAIESRRPCAEHGDERDEREPDHQRGRGRGRAAGVAHDVLARERARRRRRGGAAGQPDERGERPDEARREHRDADEQQRACRRRRAASRFAPEPIEPSRTRRTPSSATPERRA